MAGFELRISSVGSDRSANCATTTAHSNGTCQSCLLIDGNLSRSVLGTCANKMSQNFILVNNQRSEIIVSNCLKRRKLLGNVFFSFSWSLFFSASTLKAENLESSKKKFRQFAINKNFSELPLVGSDRESGRSTTTTTSTATTTSTSATTTWSHFLLRNKDSSSKWTNWNALIAA